MDPRSVELKEGESLLKNFFIRMFNTVPGLTSLRVQKKH